MKSLILCSLAVLVFVSIISQQANAAPPNIVEEREKIARQYTAAEGSRKQASESNQKQAATEQRQKDPQFGAKRKAADDTSSARAVVKS